ncbi:hypothetical protein JTB14_034609 [Gonioctena quinquepunctata]|nr:hypothetical protein JTB14_034609 [Gonioctena quinquepunctata]
MSLNLNSEDIELLQGYLGHEDKIHREFYRQPIIERDILNISKVLRAAQTISPNDTLLSSSRIVPTPYNAVQPSTSVLERATITPNSIPHSPVEGPSHALYDPMRSSGSEYNPSGGSSSSEDSILDDVMSTPKHRRRRLRVMSPGQAAVKGHWGTPERHAAIRLFDGYLTTEKLPTTREIGKAIQDCPELRNRTIPQIKIWISNRKKSKRAKSVWGTPQKQTVKRFFKNFIEGETSCYPGKELI